MRMLSRKSRFVVVTTIPHPFCRTLRVFSFRGERLASILKEGVLRIRVFLSLLFERVLRSPF